MAHQLTKTTETIIPTRKEALMRRNFGFSALAFSLACAFGGISQAETLRIGLASETTAVDPHFHQTTPNEALISHIFEGLVKMSPDMELQPALAHKSE